MRHALIAAVGVTMVAAVLASPAQVPQQPVFTAGTDLVEVQAVVTDKKGSVVRGLTREDFQAKAGVTLTTSVRGTDGKFAFTNSFELAAADLAAGEAGYSRVAQVPLTGLATGAYELAIDARSKSGRTASQRIPFNIK